MVVGAGYDPTTLDYRSKVLPIKLTHYKKNDGLVGVQPTHTLNVCLRAVTVKIGAG